MTSATTQNTNTAKGISLSGHDYRLSFSKLLRSEWIKLTSVRSTWWSVAIVAAMSLGFSTLMAFASRDFSEGFTPISAVTSSIQFSMLMAGVMGAISITGEYSTGMVRSTFTAAPRRASVVFAKAIVLSLFMIMIGIIIFGVTTLVVNPIMNTGIDFASFDNTWLPLIWAVLSLAFFALIGLSFGFIVRNGAGAIALTVGLIFVLPIILTGIFGMSTDPAWAWVNDLIQYLPMMIAATLTSPGESGTTDLHAALGMLGWVVVGLGASVLAVRSRDV